MIAPRHVSATAVGSSHGIHTTSSHVGGSALAATIASSALPDYPDSQYIDGLTASEDDEDDVEDEVASHSVPLAGRVFTYSCEPTVAAARATATQAPSAPSQHGHNDGQPTAGRQSSPARAAVSPGRYDYEEEVVDLPLHGARHRTPPASPGRYDYEEPVEAEVNPSAPVAHDAKSNSDELAAMLAKLDSLAQQAGSLRSTIGAVSKSALTAEQKQRATDEISRAFEGF